MRVCIVGAGAIGSFLGAHLSRSGSDVAALARGATAAALRAHGFQLEQAGALVTAKVRVVEDTAGLGAQDLVVLAVKGPSLIHAAEKDLVAAAKLNLVGLLPGRERSLCRHAAQVDRSGRPHRGRDPKPPCHRLRGPCDLLRGGAGPGPPRVRQRADHW